MKKSIFNILATIFLFIPLTARCDVSVEVYCFSSNSGESKSFEFRSFFDRSTKFSSGFVKYVKATSALPLVWRARQEEELSKDSPFQVTEVWLEVANGRLSGEYEMISQGTNIESMVYTNYSTHRKTSFLLDRNVIGTQDKGCQW